MRGVSSAIGIVLTPALGQFGGNPDGWRYAMFVMGGLSIFSGLLILLFVHEPKHVSHGGHRGAESPRPGYSGSATPRSCSRSRRWR